uniref:Chloroplast acetyl coA carboxylase n=1 Tax=Trachelium caeruleum TaxID=28494 RepID=M9PA16_TRACE|nr:nuclear acetyl coA carboxylase [synthetic construct]AFZ94928.1 chloroplast acetyl coA carboxylase [Trachelium caeruleum]AFZ94938.1 chloroplast acetyl coA carboxylase [Trachelium caeruleum]
MAGIAATCSSIFECNRFGSIDSQRCRKFKAMASPTVSRMRTGVLAGSGVGGLKALSSGAEAWIEKGCKTTNPHLISYLGSKFMGPHSISISHATTSYATKQESYQKYEDDFDPSELFPPVEDEDEEAGDSYMNRYETYQRDTGLADAVQTGTGELNGIPIALAVMDFQFMGGSMGSVVGEKITRLIEYAGENSLPLIIVCASGGARMQEGSLSLMQMAKISAALYDYQSNKKLFYIPILTSPTTGGVTASFAMLGDIIISEPGAYIAFAGKRVIEETLKIKVPDGVQQAEYLFEKGQIDLIVPRPLMKDVLTELLQFHGFLPKQKQVKQK